MYRQPKKIKDMPEPIMERLLGIMEKVEAEMMAKLDACREKMQAWLKEMDNQEVTEACREEMEAI
jgi:hypothetical protein